MRAISLHRDVIVVTSAILQVNCVIVRGAAEERPDTREGPPGGETFVIDSPVLPDELDALPALLEQAGFPAPSGLLGHARRLGPPARARSPSPASRSAAPRAPPSACRRSPGEAQRELRAFDEDLLIERARPLALGSVQALPVPGRCAVGERELELYAAGGHTAGRHGDPDPLGGRARRRRLPLHRRAAHAQRRGRPRGLSRHARAPAPAGRRRPSTSCRATARSSTARGR